MYEKYKDRAAFYVIYIREAHPSDAWQMPVNVRENVVFTDPRNSEQRSEVASMCVRRLGIQLPALVDDSGDSTERAYTGWPDRLYLIDRSGKIAFKSAAGPFGFHPADLEKALQRTGL